MEFKFKCPDEDIVAAHAFAFDKDNNIQLGFADGKETIDIRSLANIVGIAMNHTSYLKNDGTDNDFVEKRDLAHELIRLFAEGLSADSLAANWLKPNKNQPPTYYGTRDVFFVVKGQKEEDPHAGYFRGDNQCFYNNDGDIYRIDDVAYWMPYPKAPMQKIQEE